MLIVIVVVTESHFDGMTTIFTAIFVYMCTCLIIFILAYVPTQAIQC